MYKLGTVVAVMALASLVGVAQAKTTRVVAKPTAKQAKEKPVAKAKAKAAKKAEPELIVLVGKSPFANVNLAPVRSVHRRGSHRAWGLRALRHRASVAPRLSLRASAAMPSDDQTVLRMRAQTLRSRDINKVIRAHFGRIQACYEHAVAHNRAPKGSVSVRFVIAPNGTVAKANVTCGKAHRALARCIEHRIVRWSFPRADAPTTVDYPFVFDVAESSNAR